MPLPAHGRLWPLLLIAVLLYGFGLSAFAQPPASRDAEVLCVVNGDPIPRAGINKAVQQKWGRKILEDLIEQMLIFQAAEARGLSISEEELKARLNAAKSEYESLEAFNKMMTAQGIKGPAFRRQLRAQMLLEKLVEQLGAITEEETRQYYEANISDYQSTEQRHVHAIVAEDAERAYQARQQVAEGADFDEVAAGLDGEMCGDWDWLTKDDLRVALIRETVFSLRAGDVSNPIFIDGQYYVLWVEEVRPGVDRGFEEVKDEIVTEIRAQRGISADSIVAGLWRKAQISVPWKAYYYLEDEYGRLDEIKVSVDDERVAMPLSPVILDNGHMLVMSKPLLQAMAAKTTWDADNQAMSATTEAGTIQVKVGSVKAHSGDRVVLMPEAPQLRDGSLFVSPRPVVSALGGSIKWDPVSYTLQVTTSLAEEGSQQ